MANSQTWRLLSAAVRATKRNEFATYFDLRHRLRRTSLEERPVFEKAFATYYRLHIGGLTPEFKRRYFELFWAFDPTTESDPHTRMLTDLYLFPRRQGDHTIQASFVSKLVAMHDESRPIYDKYVGQFFGLGVPGVGSVEFRIAGFIANLHRIQNEYEGWAADGRFSDVLSEFAKKQPDVRDCHATRVCDFLVWSIGAKALT